MIQRAFRYRMAPTKAQETALEQFAGATRFIYNLAWEQRRDFWRQYRAATGGSLNFASQGREVTALRREVDWIGAVPSSALHQALRDLDKAFTSFFRGRGRFPTPRKKGANESFRIQTTQTGMRIINRRWAAARVPNLGWVKFRLTRAIRGRVQNATFSCIAGEWFVSFACEIEHEMPANDNPAIGIDRGISIGLALSNGERFNLPASLSDLDKRKRRAQRVLSRRQRGSARYRKQRRRVSRLAAKIGRVRADWQHRISRVVADRFGQVAIEDLKISNMTTSGRGKRGLNRSILEQGWGAFADKLAYKLEARGGALIKVNPAFTSQCCSACGTIDARNRESQASFACVECGFRANADHNAAINILRRSTSAMPVEGRGYAPVEAGTCLEAA